MLLALQIPLVDARTFLVDLPYKLDRPDFLFGPDEERRLHGKPPEFMRGFGPFQERNRSPVADWPAEGYYCRAQRAVRLTSAFAPAPEGVRFEGAFRRFLSNGNAVARFEIGLARPRRAATTPLTGPDVTALLERFAELEVSVRTERVPLILAGGPLAGHVLRNTTDWQSAGRDFEPSDWWVKAGRPLALLEYERDELAAMPDHARSVPNTDPGLQIHHLKLDATSPVPPTWLIGLAPGANLGRSREIRVHLFRLHAEREALRRMLRHLADKNVPLPAADAVRSELDDYLDKAVGFLKRETVYGNAQSDLLQTAYGYDDLFAGGDRHSLMSALEQRRRSLARRLVDLAPANATVDGYEFPLA